MKKIRFGIIGLGNQGGTYLYRFFGEDKIDKGCVTAVCDIDQNKLDLVKEKAGDKGIALFADYIQMLDSGLCDAVLVETPHYAHPEMVVECLKRDIHVICEKPAGVYAQQVREMNEVAKKSKARFGMMFNQRTNCLYRKMKEIIEDGGIGELQRVNWIITDWFRPQHYYDTGNWRASWKGEGGGVLINQCPHQIDLICWILGEKPQKVRGFCEYGKWHDIEVEDEVTAFFTYKNGATGVFITTTGEAPGSNRLEISGTKGKLLCENNKLLWYKNSEDSRTFSKNTDLSFGAPACEIVEVETDGQNTQHVGILNNFANALLGLEEFFVDGVEGINGVELMNAIEYSGWLGGKEVTLPVDEKKYWKALQKKCKTSVLRSAVHTEAVDTLGTYGK